MNVRMGSERHISGESAVMPLPDALPAEVAGAAAILGHGTRYKGSAKLESVAGEGHLGGLVLPKQETSVEAAESGVKKGNTFEVCIVKPTCCAINLSLDISWSDPFGCAKEAESTATCSK